MKTYAVGELALARPGAVVKIIEALPTGDKIFYRVQDVATDQESVIAARDLRPWFGAPRCATQDY